MTTTEAKDVREQELEDIKTILATSQGMRFFKRFFENASLFSTTFKQNSELSAFCEGARNQALMYFNDICEACPEKVAPLIIRKSEEFRNGNY